MADINLDDTIDFADLVTPPLDSNEGWPVPAGFTPVAVYRDQGPNRQTSRVKGVWFQDTVTGLRAASPEAVEQGVFNTARAALYQLWRMLIRLQRIINARNDWNSEIDYNGEDSISIADYYNYDASGNGTTVYITWTPGDTNDARGPVNSENGGNGGCIEPGMLCYADPGGTYGIAEIKDVEFTGTGSATLTLTNVVNADQFGGVWLARPHNVPWAPVYHPSIEGEQVLAAGAVRRCIHAVRVPHSALKTWKTYNGGSDWAAGIYEQWYCTKLKEGTVDLSQFVSDEGKCKNVDCPFYAAFTPGYFSGAAFTKFLLSRGFFYDHTVALSTDPLDILVGQVGVPGLLFLAGFPLYYLHSSYANQPYKDYLSHGILERDTGEVDEYGLPIYRNWQNDQDAYALAEGAESDDIDFWLDLTQVSKPNPNGGRPFSLSNPGGIFERAIGVQQIGCSNVANDQIITDDGFEYFQRAMPRKITSPTFTAASTASVSDDDTALEFFATPQATPNGFAYDAVLSLGRFRDRAGVPGTAITKSVTGSVYSAVLSFNPSFPDAGGLEIEWNLGSDMNSWFLAEEGEPGGGNWVEGGYYRGGNVVAGDISWESRNALTDGRVGSRQEKLYPGDLVSFNIEGLTDAFLECTEAEAFAGTVHEVQGPHADALGHSQFLRDNYGRSDTAVFSSKGTGAHRLFAWMAQPGNSLAEKAIHTVKRGGVSPVGYTPTIGCYNISTGAASPGFTSYFDPVEGKVYFTRPASGSCRIHFSGHLYYIRKTYVVENVTALKNLVWHYLGNLFWQLSKEPVSCTYYLRHSYRRPSDGLVIYYSSFMAENDYNNIDASAELGDLVNTAVELDGWEFVGSELLAYEGAVFDSGADRADPFHMSFEAHTYFGGSFFKGTVNAHPDEISEARVQVIINGASAWRTDYLYTLAGGVVTDAEVETDFGAVGIYSLTPQDDGSMKRIVADFGVGGLTEDEYGNWYGEADVTDFVKELAANPNATTTTVWGISAPGALTDVTSPGGELFSYLTAYSQTFEEIGSPPVNTLTRREYTWYRFAHGGMSFGTLRVRLNPDAMFSNAANFHFDETKRTGTPMLLPT